MSLDKSKFLDEDETTTLRRACEDAANADLAKGRTGKVRDWMIIDFGLSTGLRASEMINLKIGDLDLRKKTMRVRRLKRKIPKVDTVPLNSALVAHIKEYLRWKERIGEASTSESHLLTSKRGGKYSLRAFEYAFKRCLRRAGLSESYCTHSMRHTFATRIQELKGDLRLTQTLLGHSKIQTTVIYAGVTFKKQIEVIEELY